jgi:hypothetical protein
VLRTKFNTEAKVYRAYNKSHVFFTVFSKEAEEAIHKQIGDKPSLEVEASIPDVERHPFRVVTYSAYEKALRERLMEMDRISDELPEYMKALNL